MNHAQSKALRASEQELRQAILDSIGDDSNGVDTEAICRETGRTPQELGAVFESLKVANELRGFGGRWFTSAGFEEGQRRFLVALLEAHRQLPTAIGIPADQVASAAGLAWTGKPLDRIVAEFEARGKVSVSSAGLRHAEFRPNLPPRQRQFLDRIIEALELEAIDVPGPHELARTLVAPPQAIEEVLRLGDSVGELVFVAEGIYFTPRQLAALVDRLRVASKGQPFSAVMAREILGTTRKYATPLLEYFDETGVTRRVGGMRTI